MRSPAVAHAALRFECFAAIGSAAYAVAAGDAQARGEALEYFATFLQHSFTPGVMPPKTDPGTRPMKGAATLMIAILTAQEIRRFIGNVAVCGANCTQWIDRAVEEIERDFFKPDVGAPMEKVAPNGDVIDHFDGPDPQPGPRHRVRLVYFA